MIATMDRVRRSLEEEAREEDQEPRGGVPPVEVDPPVRGALKGKHREKAGPVKAVLTRGHSDRGKSAPDGASVGLDHIDSIGESHSSILWGAERLEDEWNVSHYLNAQSPSQEAERMRGAADSQSSSTAPPNAEKEMWFRYVDRPAHTAGAHSSSRFRNISPPQVRPERRHISTAGAKLSGEGSMDSVDFGGGSNELYKGEWSLSLSVARPEGSDKLSEGLEKSSVLMISGSGISNDT